MKNKENTEENIEEIYYEAVSKLMKKRYLTPISFDWYESHFTHNTKDLYIILRNLRKGIYVEMRYRKKYKRAKYKGSYYEIRTLLKDNVVKKFIQILKDFIKAAKSMDDILKRYDDSI